MNSRHRFFSRAAAVLLALVAVAGCAKRMPPLPTYDTIRSDPAYAKLHAELAGFDASAVRGKKIVLDPGHGGAFPGAIGKKGTHEANINLAVGLYLWAFLGDAGADVLLTRTSDRDFLKPGEKDPRPDLNERVRIANEFHPDLFISLHHNAEPTVNRKVNRTETYFKMSDTGPSLDVAERIHRRLVEALQIHENRLLPGNYFVVRRAEGTAVLGEAAHISNPEMEKRLDKPETLAREAAGYFEGIADYFRDGVPDVKDAAPRDTTLETVTPLITARIEDDRGFAIDPFTVELRLDGEAVSSQFDPAGGLATYRPANPIANGRHQAELHARNVRGNATPERSWEFRTAAPPARVLLASTPGGEPAKGPLAVTALVLDAFGQAVADSTEVNWSVATASLLSIDAPPSDSAAAPVPIGRTRQGTTTVYLERAVGASVSARAADVSSEMQGPASARENSGFCVDARDGRAIAGAWIEAEGTAELSNRDGFFAVPDSAETLRVRAAGYRETVSPAALRMALEPVAGGVLRGVSIALDPEGGGDDPGGLGPTSLRAADLNLRVALTLRGMLEAAGARVALTRESDVPVSPLERVLRAEAVSPARYIRIGHRALRKGEPPVSAGSYPGSRDGARLARDLAAAIDHEARVVEDAQYTLQQTSAPAVFVNLASIADPASEKRLMSAAELRREAYALYRGILSHFGASEGSVVEGHVAADGARSPADAIVTLDGYLSISPAEDGSFRFERVEPGAHRIAAEYAGGPKWERAFETSADATTVDFGER